jgi:enamine deaminase RidA (YjgF/YER057c/UK114 family)
MSNIEDKIRDMGLRLPTIPKPVAAYVPAIKIGDLVFTAGQIPTVEGELVYKGCVGEDLSLDDGYAAARICCLNALSAVKGVIDSLDKIEKIVKLTVFVNSASDFTQQPAVANGASDLVVKIFGEAGKHARSAVGTNTLPLGAAVEVEMIVKIKQ